MVCGIIESHDSPLFFPVFHSIQPAPGWLRDGAGVDTPKAGKVARGGRRVKQNAFIFYAKLIQKTVFT